MIYGNFITDFSMALPRVVAAFVTWELYAAGKGKISAIRTWHSLLASGGPKMSGVAVEYNSFYSTCTMAAISQQALALAFLSRAVS